MTFPSSIPLCVRGGFCILAGVAGLAGSCRAQSEYDPDWTMNLRAGGMTALGIRGRLSLQGNQALSGHDPGPPGVSGVNHFYDDGYVRVDETGNAQGYTSFWGYQQASQYDAGTQRLLMHSAASFSASGSASERNDFSVGAELAYGTTLKRWESTRLGWELGFGYLPFKVKDESALGAFVNRSTYSFNVGNIVMPTAPYNGGPSGLGPTIHDVATLVDTGLDPATLSGSRTLDVNLFTLRLGPTLYYDVSSYVGVSASAGPAVGLASQTYRFNETLHFSDGSTAANNGSFSGTDVTYGGYVGATVDAHVVRGGDFYVGVQYMPMTGTKLTNGGREGTLEFGGQVYFSVGFNWSF
jgi:hypothetical protein